MSIKCLISGHLLTLAQYRGVMPNMSSPLLTYNRDGSVNYQEPKPVGFLYWGTYSICDRCGKEIDVSETKLPILMPKNY